MERWGIGVNGYYGNATISRDTGPAWTFWLMDLTERFHGLYCRIPLPKFVQNWKIKDGSGEYTVEEYYGETLCGLFAVVESKVYSFCSKRQKSASIDVDMRAAAKAFHDGQPPNWWQKSWDIGTELWLEHEAEGDPMTDSFRKSSAEKLVE
jgi:hypothetical protein